MSSTPPDPNWPATSLSAPRVVYVALCAACLGLVSLAGKAESAPAMDQDQAERGEAAKKTPIKGAPFMAYGASATSREVVAVRFEYRAEKLTAKIVQREQLDFEAAPVVFHPRHRLLYVASLRAKEGEGNKLLAYSVDRAGKLTRGKGFPLAHGSAYLSLDRAGKFLLSASYFEGHVDVHRLDQRGLPERLVDTTHEGRDKAHSILATRNNRFAYVPYVKDQNALFQYAFDEKSGKLRPLDPPQAELPAGVGPRHVAHHPSKPLVYFSNEQHLGATAFRMNEDGRLGFLQVCDPGKLKPTAGVAASDITITNDGRFLFVGVRDFSKGPLDAIHRYKVLENGKLAHLGKIDADAIPWGLELSPDGRYLLVTAAHGDSLTAYAIGEQGNLVKTASLEWGKMIRDIAVVVSEPD